MPNPPTFIYKLVSPPFPDTLPEILPVSELDLKSGFIHLSTAIQAPRTLKHFFSQEAEVHVLRIPYEPIEKNIKWEDPKAEVCGDRGGEGMFPHLYNGLRLGSNEIESVQVWKKAGDSWDEALKNATSWLIY
jgi:uncharacterized protein (DUF952 family)